MVLPLYANLEKHDPTLIEAAVDLGCRPSKAFWAGHRAARRSRHRRRLPARLHPGGGRVRDPDLLGGSQTLMIGRTLWLEFFQNRDWPLASAVAVLLLLVLVVPIALFQRQQAGREGLA
jgi:putrescine transport system permease protein